MSRMLLQMSTAHCAVSQICRSHIRGRIRDSLRHVNLHARPHGAAVLLPMQCYTSCFYRQIALRHRRTTLLCIFVMHASISSAKWLYAEQPEHSSRIGCHPDCCRFQGQAPEGATHSASLLSKVTCTPPTTIPQKC